MGRRCAACAEKQRERNRAYARRKRAADSMFVASENAARRARWRAQMAVDDGLLARRLAGLAAWKKARSA
jgi:hypothetical protein